MARTGAHTVLRAAMAAFLAITFAVGGCGGGNDADGDLTVVVTTSILGDVVEQIVRDDASVEVLIPVGADPHDYQASAQQAAAIRQADLVVANGLMLEEGLSDMLERAAADGANVLELAPLLDPIPFSASIGHADPVEDDHGDDDPHVWLDPVRMADGASIIADAMEQLDGAVDWAARADEYGAELLATDEEIRALLDRVPVERRKLITNHGSLGYFAERYGFEVIGTVVPGGSTLADPSSAELAAVVDLIEAEGVPAIFAETTEPSSVAEAVAREVGTEIEVVELYTGSLGEPGSGADTLVGLLLTDARRIADALS